MCGLVGGLYPINLKNNYDNEIKLSSDLIAHRGPDDQGFRSYTIDKYKLCNAFRRLSIIDLSSYGFQPMESGRQSSIVFNGEIYNYLELKKQLQSFGIEFHSKTDSEVLLKSLDLWGVEALEKLDGMFSFAYFNFDKKELILSRDQFGIKPLFYSLLDNSIFFSSEIAPLLQLTGIKRAANKDIINSYLNKGSTKNAEETFFQNIKSINPGTYLVCKIEKNELNIHSKKWTKTHFPQDDIGFEASKAKIKKTFMQQLDLQLRSDVPIAFTLSGGIDSSAICSAVRKMYPDKEINTFSYESNDNSSESSWFNELNKHIGAKGKTVFFNDNNFRLDLLDLIRTQGEPFISTSIYAQYCIHRSINKSNLKVVLGGQGADELLGGYTGYPYHTGMDYLRNDGVFSLIKFLKSNQKRFRSNNLLTALAILKSSMGLKTNLSRFIHSDKANDFLINDYFSIKNINTNGYQNKISDSFLINELFTELVEKKIPTLLRYEDRNSMRWSVESRVPYLNPVLLRDALSMNFSYLVNKDSVTKYLFRESMRGIVPDYILDRKDKIGFQTPESRIFEKNWEFIKSLLIQSPEIPFIDKKNFLQHCDFVSSNTGKYSPIIWRVINLFLWSKIFKVSY